MFTFTKLFQRNQLICENLAPRNISAMQYTTFLSPPTPRSCLSFQVRCCQYWPELGTTKDYGKFQVVTQLEQVDRVYITRRFKLLNNQVCEWASTCTCIYTVHVKQCMYMYTANVGQGGKLDSFLLIGCAVTTLHFIRNLGTLMHVTKQSLF